MHFPINYTSVFLGFAISLIVFSPKSISSPLINSTHFTSSSPIIYFDHINCIEKPKKKRKKKIQIYSEFYPWLHLSQSLQWCDIFF